MAKDALENGKRFLAEVLGWTAEQIAALDETKIKAAGEHVLRQDDYSAGMQDVQTKGRLAAEWKANLERWKTTVDGELAEGRAARERLKALDAGGGGNLRTGGDGDGDGKPMTVDLSGYTKKDDVDKLVRDTYSSATALSTYTAALMAGIAVTHLQEFGAPLDTMALLQFCRERNIQIDRGGYDTFVKDQRDEKAKKVHEDELKAAEERGRQRGINESSGALPFPTSNGSLGFDGNHTLEGLGNKAFDKSTAVERAVATFRGEQHARGSGGAS